jgi:hypothetical protein
VSRPGAAPWGEAPKALRGDLHHAALSHIEVSNALHIIGMFMPKLGLVPLLGTATFAAGFGAAGAAGAAGVLLIWAVSVARSHDPISWERATEKNRNT